MPTWWPILDDVIGYGGGPEYHAVDMMDEANKDRRPPLAARCGVRVWKLYGVNARDTSGAGAVLIMSWPPKLSVARQGFPNITGVCADCKTLATPKRPSGSWDRLRRPDEEEVA